MKHLIMIFIHLIALLFFFPALLITIPLHLIAKLSGPEGAQRP